MPPSTQLPTVALVGRPNVGKSRIFNRLSGTRRAIVHDLAGVTRDVNSIVVNHHYTLLDTGGIGLVVDMDHEKLIAAAEAQVWLAVEAADLICHVVDVRDGLTALDEMIAERLRASGKPVLLIANKADHPYNEERITEFSRLGHADVHAVSAEHGRNFETLEDAIANAVGPLPEAPQQADQHRIHLAFIGRPNVGKSSLCNRLLDDDRLVVSEVPGTTRDSVMLDLDYRGKDDTVLPFRLVDTAGLRRHRRVSHSVEFFSSLRSRDAIERSDIIFLVIDAEEGITRQDKTLAGEIIEAGKPLALIVNKWDLAIDKFRASPPEAYNTIAEFRKAYAEAALSELFFMPEAPVLFVSALRGFSMDRLLRVARSLWETSGRQLTTPQLNKLLGQLMEKREPRYTENKRFKVYYTVQTGIRPFVFRMFCNRAGKLEDGYRRYLQHALVRHFHLGGCPIQFDLRGKEVRYAETPLRRKGRPPSAAKKAAAKKAAAKQSAAKKAAARKAAKAAPAAKPAKGKGKRK
jgi:GTP-binding protein